MPAINHHAGSRRTTAARVAVFAPPSRLFALAPCRADGKNPGACARPCRAEKYIRPIKEPCGDPQCADPITGCPSKADLVSLASHDISQAQRTRERSAL